MGTKGGSDGSVIGCRGGGAGGEAGMGDGDGM